MRIAIAVPSLNQALFLGAALDSLAGSAVGVHVAVLDGGSTDGSRELIESRASALSCWRSGPDAGQAAAVNEGIARLCELHPDVEAVGWLNADDAFVSGGIDRLWQALVDNPGWLVACGRGALTSDAGAVVGEIHTEPFDRERFARACTICQPATLIRRSAWEHAGGLDTSLHMCFDYDLWWRINRNGPIGYVNEVVACSRDHAETKTRRHRVQYFREATAIVRRETGRVPWHWYISAAMERQVQFEVGRRPPLAARLRAGAEAMFAYISGGDVLASGR
jgi:GT2 family glycosyltransferase